MNNKVERKNKPLSEIVKSKFSQVTHFSAFISILFMNCSFSGKQSDLKTGIKDVGSWLQAACTVHGGGQRKWECHNQLYFCSLGIPFSINLISKDNCFSGTKNLNKIRLLCLSYQNKCNFISDQYFIIFYLFLKHRQNFEGQVMGKQGTIECKDVS